MREVYIKKIPNLGFRKCMGCTHFLPCSLRGISFALLPIPSWQNNQPCLLPFDILETEYSVFLFALPPLLLRFFSEWEVHHPIPNVGHYSVTTSVHQVLSDVITCKCLHFISLAYFKYLESERNPTSTRGGGVQNKKTKFE